MTKEMEKIEEKIEEIYINTHNTWEVFKIVGFILLILGLAAIPATLIIHAGAVVQENKQLQCEAIGKTYDSSQYECVELVDRCQQKPWRCETQ